MALLAMLSGLGLPLHAYAQHARAGGPGGDFCVAGKAGKSAPAVPDRAHAAACDMCCGCTAGNAAPPSAEHAATLSATFVAACEAAVAMRTASPVGSALPRGPPPLA